MANRNTLDPKPRRAVSSAYSGTSFLQDDSTVKQKQEEDVQKKSGLFKLYHNLKKKILSNLSKVKLFQNSVLVMSPSMYSIYSTESQYNMDFVTQLTITRCLAMQREAANWERKAMQARRRMARSRTRSGASPVPEAGESRSHLKIGPPSPQPSLAPSGLSPFDSSYRHGKTSSYAPSTLGGDTYSTQAKIRSEVEHTRLMLKNTALGMFPWQLTLSDDVNDFKAYKKNLMAEAQTKLALLYNKEYDHDGEESEDDSSMNFTAMKKADHSESRPTEENKAKLDRMREDERKQLELHHAKSSGQMLTVVRAKSHGRQPLAPPEQRPNNNNQKELYNNSTANANEPNFSVDDYDILDSPPPLEYDHVSDDDYDDRTESFEMVQRNLTASDESLDNVS